MKKTWCSGCYREKLLGVGSVTSTREESTHKTSVRRRLGDSQSHSLLGMSQCCHIYPGKCRAMLRKFSRELFTTAGFPSEVLCPDLASRGLDVAKRLWCGTSGIPARYRQGCFLDEVRGRRESRLSPAPGEVGTRKKNVQSSCTLSGSPFGLGYLRYQGEFSVLL